MAFTEYKEYSNISGILEISDSPLFKGITVIYPHPNVIMRRKETRYPLQASSSFDTMLYNPHYMNIYKLAT